MRVHSTTVVAEQWLGHVRYSLSVLRRRVPDYVFIEHHVVGRFDQRVETLIDFTLSSGSDLVVMAFDIETAFDHGHDHFGAKILMVVRGCDREVAFLITRAISEIVFFAPGIPSALFGIDEIEAGMGILVEADIVKNEKFSLSA